MSKNLSSILARPSHIPAPYLETNVGERYEDAAKRIYLAQQRQEALKAPGDIKLGPYLTVGNFKEFTLRSQKKDIQSAIHPILEGDVSPNPNIWYVISGIGDRPSLRVGHTASFVAGMDNNPDQVLFIGGANPSEMFSDIHSLNLESFQWNMSTPTGFSARYEHIAVVPASQPNKIYVLAGANQEGNLSDIQCYNSQEDNWSTIKVSGNVPISRTHHTNAACNDCAYLFSGGKSGAEPVQDRQVHCFDISTHMWSPLGITGESPAPRHGHSLTSYEHNKLICFGGMAGTKFYNDVHILDLERHIWNSCKVKKRLQPEPRAGHAAASHGKFLYIFGGMNKEGMALDDLWKLDLTNQQWSQVVVEGPPPAPRLDMASCIIKWKPKADSSELQNVTETLNNTQISADDENEEKDNSKMAATSEPAHSQLSHFLLLIHGGMDTQGEIFDDCLVIRLSE